MMRGSTVSELAVEKARISSSFRIRISVQIRRLQMRATAPSTTNAKKAIAKYTSSTSLARGSNEAKPKLATVTAIRPNTPIGA
ncbi:hypothetical protein D3C80_2048400 [compost metagenome]